MPDMKIIDCEAVAGAHCQSNSNKAGLQMSQTLNMGANTTDLREKFEQNEDQTKYMDKLNAMKDFSGIMRSLSNDSN